ncbi:MAG: histidinol dehydrogenase, partial [Planctomycetota bacterium]
MATRFDELLIRATETDSRRMKKLRTEHSMAEYLKSRGDFAKTVREIVADVAARGDAAVAEYTEKFDKVTLAASEFRVSPDALKAAHESLDANLLESLRKSIANVQKYQTEIFIGNKTTHPGIRYTPLKRVACCIPGASAPLPSTVIMTAVPAQIAGVKEIVILSPPRYAGSIHPVILGLCYELGITEVYRLGGAQAVAALVQLAKKECFGLVDMDSFAGPSDVLIVANDQANPAWVAADMLSQAEHDPGAGIVVTDNADFAKKVLAELETQCAKLDRAEATKKCLLAYSGIVVCENMDAVIDWANDFAAEHLQVQCG